MTNNRTALYAVSASWLAVLLVVVLSLVLGEVQVPLAVFVGIVAPSVTCFWAVRANRSRR